MAEIDLHKFALTVGFEVVCVDDEYTNYEYTVRLRDIESMSYVLGIKNKIIFEEVPNIISSIVIVLPRKLRFKLKKMMKKTDENNIDNVIDLLCYTVSEYNRKTKFMKLKEYGELVGVDIEECGYFFTYKLNKKKYAKILSTIESKLPIEHATALGKLRKIDYKIGYIKKHNSEESQII